MSVLQPLGPDLWEVTADAPLGALRSPVRSVIARLPEGLWVHSPIPLTPALADAVEAVGPIAHLVSPNHSHYLFLPEWQQRFPDARVWRPQMLNTSEALFEGIDQQTIHGVPKMEECVFLHRASKTLIVTDLFLNVRTHPNWMTRAAFGMLGAYGRPKQAFLWRWRTTDRKAARESLETILR